MNQTADSRFDTALRQAVTGLGVALTAAQRAALRQHRRLVTDANRRFNLTRLTEPESFAVKHHADSLALLSWCDQAGCPVRRILDIGTGAGLPAVPLAVARPNWSVTAIDGTGKKARFVAAVADMLRMGNLAARHARAESWSSAERFDLVVLKAVGPLARCLRLAARHVSAGGWVIVYKTASIRSAERRAGADAAGALGFSQPCVHRYDIALGDQTLRRALWCFPLTAPAR